MARIVNSYEEEDIQQKLFKKYRVASAEVEKERGIEGDQIKVYEDSFASPWDDDQLDDPFCKDPFPLLGD